MIEPQVEQFANNPQTTLAGNALAGDATISVTSAAAFPATGQFRLVIDNEILLVTNVAGTTFTVTRGVEGTAAAGHNAGVTVTCILTAAAVQAVATNPIGSAGVRGQGVLVAAHFDQGQQSLYLLASVDGISWDYVVAAPFLQNLVRDPSVYFDGSFWWVAFTRATTPFASWALYKSSDLVNWSFVVNVDCSGIVQPSGAVTLAWAPEFFVDSDGSLHVIVSLGHANNTMQLYEQHPTANDLTTWSAAVALAGTALPADMIDAFMVKSGGTYYCFYKNDSNKYYEVMTSTSLTTGYTVQGSAHWMTNWPLVSGNGWEGWSMAQIDSNTWYAWVDSTDVSDNGLGYQYSVYTGAAGAGWLTGANWSNLAPTKDPMTKRHGTILRLQDLPSLRTVLAARMGNKRNPKTKVKFGANFSVPNSATQQLFWDTKVTDDLGMWVASGSKLTAQVSGWYHIGAWVHWAGNNNGFRVIDLRVNGTIYFGGRIDAPTSLANDTKQFAGSDQYYLNAGDYVEVAAFQTSGGGLNVTEGFFFASLQDW